MPGILLTEPGEFGFNRFHQADEAGLAFLYAAT
jgi:hypothetical protein